MVEFKEARKFRVLLAGIFFLSNCTWAYASEPNFWESRKRSAVSLAEAPSQLARLPTDLNPLSSLTRRAPELGPPSLVPAGLPADTRLPLYSLLQLVPSRHGTVRSVQVPAEARKTVLHIQDIHLNREAQANIGLIIQPFIEEKKVELIGLEGAFAPIKLAPIRNYPDKAAIPIVSEYLLRENRISGAVHAALTSGGEIPPLIGVDDSMLHQANIEAYKASIHRNKTDRARLSRLKRGLNSRIQNSFSQELAHFHARVESHREGQTSFPDTLQFLSKLSHHFYPQVELFLEAVRLEETLDFKQVEEQRNRFLTKLMPALNHDDTLALTTQSLAFHLGKIRHHDFYGYLKTLAQRHNVSLSETPAFEAYLSYVLLSESIDTRALFSEAEQMEREAYAALIQTSEEASLVREAGFLHLAGKLMDFALTPEEWEAYKGHLEDTELNQRNALLAGGALKTYEDFYRIAEARDQAMTRNLLAAMDEHKASTAILVTGGFHTPGIDRLMKNAGVATVTVAPQLTRVEDETGSSYLSVFAREKTPLDQIFKGERLFVAHSPTDFGGSPNLLAASTLNRNPGGTSVSQLNAHLQETRDIDRPADPPPILSANAAADGTVTLKKPGGALKVQFDRDHEILSVDFAGNPRFPSSASVNPQEPETTSRKPRRQSTLLSTAKKWLSLLAATGVLSGVGARAQFDPAAPIKTVEDAIAFTDFQLNTANFPSHIQTPLLPSFYVPVRLSGYFIDTFHKAMMDNSISLYDESLDMLARISTGRKHDLDNVEKRLLVWARGRYGTIETRAYPNQNNGQSFQPLTAQDYLLFEWLMKDGDWRSMITWEARTGSNAWRLLLIGEYIKAKRFFGEEPHLSIVQDGEAMVRGLMRLRTPEGFFRFGPMTPSWAWNLMSVENNISLFVAFHSWAKATGNPAFRDVAEGVWTALTETQVELPHSRDLHRGFLSQSGDRVYFFAGASYDITTRRWIADTRLASDNGMWGVKAFGIPRLDQRYGPFAALQILRTLRTETGWTAQFLPAGLTNTLAGLDFTDAIDQMRITPPHGLISPEWSAPGAFVLAAAHYGRTRAFQGTGLEWDQIERLVRDFQSVTAYLNTTNGMNYAHGPGLSSLWRGGRAFDIRAPLNKAVVAVAALGKFTEGFMIRAQENEPAGDLFSFTQFLKKSHKRLQEMEIAHHVAEYQDRGFLGHAHTTPAGESVFLAAFSENSTLNLASRTKNPTGGLVEEESIHFGPTDTTLTLTENGETVSWTFQGPNPLEQGALFMARGSSGEVMVFLELPEAFLREIPPQVERLFTQGPIKLWRKERKKKKNNLDPLAKQLASLHAGFEQSHHLKKTAGINEFLRSQNLNLGVAKIKGPRQTPLPRQLRQALRDQKNFPHLLKTALEKQAEKNETKPNAEWMEALLTLLLEHEVDLVIPVITEAYFHEVKVALRQRAPNSVTLIFDDIGLMDRLTGQIQSMNHSRSVRARAVGPGLLSSQSGFPLKQLSDIAPHLKSNLSNVVVVTRDGIKLDREGINEGNPLHLVREISFENLIGGISLLLPDLHQRLRALIATLQNA